MEEFDDEADDGRGLSTEQVSSYNNLADFLQAIIAANHYLSQVTQLMDMLCNETDVAEIELEVWTLQKQSLLVTRPVMLVHVLFSCHCCMQMGSFQLHVRRRVDASAASASQPASAATSNEAGMLRLLRSACSLSCKGVDTISPVMYNVCWRL